MAEIKKLSRSVKGLTILVTGAASGMGRATAHAFADEGANVAVTDLTAEGTRAVADAITASGGKAKAWALDADNYEEAWAKALAVMLTAHPRIIRAALPYLRKSKCPRIVNIASTEALGATATNSPYSAAKGGVASLTRSLAVELGREGITVNCICPGPIRSAITEKIPEEHKTIYAKRRTALGRYGDPEEVAHMTLSLCLPAASYLTGAIINVDGGLMARNA